MEYYTKTRIILMLTFLQQFTRVMSTCTVLTAEDYKPNIISYPGDGSSNYNTGLDICWNITSDNPILFSLSSDVGKGDYIRVFDGGDAIIMTKEDKKLNTETKLISPPVHLRFTSDGNLDATSDKGFIFRYVTGNSTVSGCGASLAATTTTNYIVSPNFPEKYNKNESCQWNIASAANTTIHLALKFMDVENENTCQYDYVQVLDPAGKDSSKLCKEIDFSPPFTFTSVENNVQIYFKSDEFSPKHGFFFTFTSSGIPLGGSLCSDNNLCKTENSTCSNGTCVCVTSYYSEAAMCIPKKELGSNCTSFAECNDINAVCAASKCSCSSDHYDDNGASTPGGQCLSKKELGSSCDSVVKCKDSNAVCSSNICSCSINHYDDNGASTLGGQCLSKKELGSSCDSVAECKTSNAVCSSKTCSCSANHYDDNGASTPRGQCLSKKELGSSCDSVVECKTSNAVCSSKTCSCSANHYDDNGASTPRGQCLSKKELGSSCDSVVECKDTNAICSASKCSCSAEDYDDNGASTLGGQCKPKRQLGATCDSFMLCNDAHATCVSNKCTCESGFYDDNGDSTGGGNCQTNAALGLNCSGIIKCGKDYICKFGKCHCNFEYPIQRDGRCHTDDSNVSSLVAAITVPTCILILSFITIGCVFCVRRRKRMQYEDNQPEPYVVKYYENPEIIKP